MFMTDNYQKATYLFRILGVQSQIHRINAAYRLFEKITTYQDAHKAACWVNQKVVPFRSRSVPVHMEKTSLRIESSGDHIYLKKD